MPYSAPGSGAPSTSAPSDHTSHRPRTTAPATSQASRSSAVADSWIAISSQHSSSSLSSAGDDVVTHGLRVTPQSSAYPRQPPPPAHRLHLDLARSTDRPQSAGESSQEEYDESESESDRVVTSSNEGLLGLGVSARRHTDSATLFEDDQDDDDGNATALGTGTNRHGSFTPQPNAFSHPPSSHSGTVTRASGSYFSPESRPAARTNALRHSLSGQQGQALSPRGTAGPVCRTDHDAALRASLTTLLSCAAAARGLPKNGASASRTVSGPAAIPGARVEPSTLRLIPESALNRGGQRSESAARSTSSSQSDKGKRKAARSSSKERRAVKRLRSAGVDEVISPTLLTWVVSAGVLVLVSALSFSAGYSAGRDQGRWEMGGDAEYGRRGGRSGLGLRRRLWSGAARVVAAA